MYQTCVDTSTRSVARLHARWWEHPELEGLNALLEDEFEIHERLAALDRKLELVARTERTIVELISTRHSLRLEWYIVILIVLEILLTIYQLWLR